MKSRAGIAFLSLSASLSLCTCAARAQVLGWLPVTDLPLTTDEVSFGPIPPAIDAMTMWDPDGDGPLPRCVVVGGVLHLTIPNAAYASYLTPDGWVGVPLPSTGDEVYSLAAYRVPGADHEDLFVGKQYGQIYRFDGASLVQVGAARLPRFMKVMDLDGDGPNAPVIVIGGDTGMFTYDGSTFAQMAGAPGGVWSATMWDSDGDGPLPARLVVGNASGVYIRNGTTWSSFAVAANVRSVCSVDFDGSGPNPPELVASGAFSTIGGVAAAKIAAYRDGAWVGLAPGTGGAIYRTTMFDPDGSGPMTPWFVIGGQFSQISGVSAQNLAYYNDGAWHSFPQHWAAITTAFDVNDGAGYSNSPQLHVGELYGARPAFGVFALCDTPPGFVQDPPNTHRPVGETISLNVNPTGDELAFRWYKGTQPLFSGTTESGSVITGAASPRLTISGLTPADAGEYHLQLGNGFGNITTASAAVSLGCAADFNADDSVDFFDYLDFVNAYAGQFTAADFNFDQTIDITDYLEFLTALSQGC